MSEGLDALLQVQEFDTVADQLRHRRATLPERALLRALDLERTGLEAELAEVRGQLAELGREQRRREDEIASLSAKITEVDKTLYGGTVRAVRELQAMQEEIQALQRRRAQLEDQTLELMEQGEPIEGAAAAIETKLSAIAQQAAQHLAALEAGERAIDAELDAVLAQRGVAAQPLSPELLSEYEDIRGRLGVGAARLVGNRCEGCHLTLSAMEIDSIRHEPPDALVHCSECGRLLVRSSA